MLVSLNDERVRRRTSKLFHQYHSTKVGLNTSADKS